MDPSILPLFTTEELLERLGQGRTGCLHVFTQKEAANIFFKEGIVVAAAKGLVEGEEVLKQILDWKDAQSCWQAETCAPPAAFKALQINIREFLARVKRGAGSKAGGKTPVVVLGFPPAEPAPLIISIPAKGRSTGPLASVEAAAPKTAPREVGADSSFQVQLTATKTIGPSSHVRSAQEEALLAKYKLALVSMENPEQKLKIARVSSLIGRNPACDIAVNHGSISRQHCLLQLTDRGLHVKDLGTTNGTKVNGITMTEGYISVGDQLTIGHLEYVLQKDGGPAPRRV